MHVRDGSGNYPSQGAAGEVALTHLRHEREQPPTNIPLPQPHERCGQELAASFASLGHGRSYSRPPSGQLLQ